MKYSEIIKKIESYIKFNSLERKRRDDEIYKIIPKKEFSEKLSKTAMKNPELNNSTFLEIYHFKENLPIKKEFASFIIYRPFFNKLFTVPYRN